MGQAHEALPLKEENGARKAGKTEEGTSCAVPVVGDEWKVDEPVPFWYVYRTIPPHVSGRCVREFMLT